MVEYTKMREERKLAERLGDRGIKAFAPTTKKMRQWSVRDNICELLAVSKIPVRVNAEKRHEVLQNPSVNYFMIDQMNKQLAKIPDDQTEEFRYIFKQSDSIVQLNPNQLDRGMKVKVNRGAFKGWSGISLTSKAKASLTFSSMLSAMQLSKCMPLIAKL